MRVAVIGVGAIGGYLAARLTVAGINPVLVARGRQLAALREKGLRVVGRDVLEVRPRVAASAAEAGPCDLVVCCIKAHGLSAAPPDIARLMGDRGRLLQIANGIPWWYGAGALGPLRGVRLESVDPGGRIAAAIDVRRVIGSAAYLRCAAPEPGVTEFIGGRGLLIGAIGAGEAVDLDSVLAMFAAAGVPTRATPDIRTVVWNKLFGNVGLNPLSAVTGLTVAELLADPGHRATLVAVGAEANAVARAAGCEPESSADERVAGMAELGAFRTSMLQDADAGRPLELAAIIDAVVELAGKLAVPVPVMSRLAANATEFARGRGLLP